MLRRGGGSSPLCRGRASAAPLAVCWVFPARFAAGCGVLWRGAFLERWECGSLIPGARPAQRPATPTPPGAIPCLSRRAELLHGRVPGRVLARGATSSRDALRAPCPSAPWSPVVLPCCKGRSVPAEGENGPNPCGFLVGVNTNTSFRGTFHQCLSALSDPFSSVSRLESGRSSVPRGRADRGAPGCCFPLSCQNQALLRRERSDFPFCCLNPI